MEGAEAGVEAAAAVPDTAGVQVTEEGNWNLESMTHVVILVLPLIHLLITTYQYISLYIAIMSIIFVSVAKLLQLLFFASF